MLTVEQTALSGVVILTPRKFEDERGYFSETYNERRACEEAGLPSHFVQDNVSLSGKKGTIRGIHFQTPPFAQDKLVRVLAGSILDVAVDLRKDSPTYGQHVAVELSAQAFNQLFIPKGFGHAFCTLEDNTQVLYKVTDYYAPQNDAGIIWNDPDLAIKWPITATQALLSAKDAKLPRFADLPDDFSCENTHNDNHGKNAR